MAIATLTALERKFLQVINSPNSRPSLLRQLEENNLLDDFIAAEKGETPVSTPVA